SPSFMTTESARGTFPEHAQRPTRVASIPNPVPCRRRYWRSSKMSVAGSRGEYVIAANPEAATNRAQEIYDPSSLNLQPKIRSAPLADNPSTKMTAETGPTLTPGG